MYTFFASVVFKILFALVCTQKVIIALQAQDWDLPHRPMTPSRILDHENGASFMFRSGTPGPVILNRRQQAFKRGYLVKKGDYSLEFFNCYEINCSLGYLSLAAVLVGEVIDQTRGRVFPPISKHRKVGWKNEAQPSQFF